MLQSYGGKMRLKAIDFSFRQGCEDTIPIRPAVSGGFILLLHGRKTPHPDAQMDLAPWREDVRMKM